MLGGRLSLGNKKCLVKVRVRGWVGLSLGNKKRLVKVRVRGWVGYNSDTHRHPSAAFMGFPLPFGVARSISNPTILSERRHFGMAVFRSGEV